MKSVSSILSAALRGGRAAPAFNFYNLESMGAILRAARATKTDVILAASPGAIKYMGDDFARFAAANGVMPVHLDHGMDFEICKHAIGLGFQSVMFDGSALPFDENVRQTRRVVQYAHKHGVFVEAELGVLSGIEDGHGGGRGNFTDPAEARRFVELTGCDSLAIAIGTSHGAYKRVEGGGLRVEVLREIRLLLPRVPLVLHGASMIPAEYTRALGFKNAGGISPLDIKRAVKYGITKVNVDSDARLAWSATMKKMFSASRDNGFDPRVYLSAAKDEMVRLYEREIRIINN